MRTLLLLLFTLMAIPVLVAQQVVSTDTVEPKTRSIEMEFFSPLTGNLTFGYEQVLNDNMSLEGKLGIIGLGVNYTNQRGTFFKGGVKFRLSPVDKDFLSSTSYMEGTYLKPEIGYNIYYSEEYDRLSNSNNTYHMLSFQLIGGVQFTAADLFVFDPYIGVGYAIGPFEEPNYPFSHIHFGNSFPLAISGGFTVGILLK